MKRLLFFSLILLFVYITGCQQPVSEEATEKPSVDNIIFLIGDGMGVVQLYSAMTVSPGPLAIEGMKHIGFNKTHSASSYTTDSAASGTAMACGVKTHSGIIGMGPDSVPAPSILHLAEKAGMSTGLVSTSAITHATPAAFIAHNVSRNNYEELASDFLETEIDVFIGGGKAHFTEREDGRNLLEALQEKQYQTAMTLEEMEGISGGKLAALLAEGHLPAQREGRNDMLPRATAKALQLLQSSPEGFFIMIEGSQIDWGGHARDQEYVISETLDFDRSVGVALEFAREHQNTLVVVTADHETGAMSLMGGNRKEHTVETHFASGGHTGVMVPVFAFGPGAEEFTGIYENTAIFDKMKKLLDL